MTTKIDKNESTKLRKKAETLLKQRDRETTLPYTEIEMLKLIHELEVHQIELEMQNHELILAQERANQAANKFTDLYDFAPVGYFTLSKEGLILELNHLGAQKLENDRSVLKNKRFDNFVSANSKPIFHQFFQEIFRNQKKENCEITLLAKDKHDITVQASGVISESGNECLLTLNDISDIAYVQQELKLRNAQLQRVIAEKDKFFSIIAHDLRGPFNGFLGLTQIMSEDLPSFNMTKIAQMVSLMRNSAINVFSLIENLLEWSRMQRGLAVYAPEKFNLEEKAKKLLGPVIETARVKEIEIIWNIPGSLQLFADPNMFSSTLRNLVNNAVKFTPKGGKIILTARPADAVHIEISVNDSGIGMSPAMLEKLFKKCEHHSRLGTDGEPSTGLGLMLCKEFVKKNGGKIWAESFENKGSTFYFTVPVRPTFSKCTPVGRWTDSK